MKTSVLESPKKICSDMMSLETKSIVLHPSSGDQHSRHKRIDAKRMRFSTKAQSMKYLQQLLRHNEDHIFTGTDRQIVSALFSKYYAINPGQTKVIVTPESVFSIITNLPFLTQSLAIDGNAIAYKKVAGRLEEAQLSPNLDLQQVGPGVKGFSHQETLGAFRLAVQDQVGTWKRSHPWPGLCPKCHQTTVPQDREADHMQPEFKDIVDEFIDKFMFDRKNIGNLVGEDGGRREILEPFRHEFSIHHHERARFSWLCRLCNMRKSSKKGDV